MIFVAFAVLIVVAVIAGAAAIAFRSKRSFVESNEIVPGTATRAPTSWAGAHSPAGKPRPASATTRRPCQPKHTTLICYAPPGGLVAQPFGENSHENQLA